MLDSNIVQAKKARYDGTKIALIKYLNELKNANLNSTHSIPPEIEDAINDQFSNLSIEDSEFLLEEIIYPGMLILREHPNALIGDVISRIFTLNSVKTVLLSSKIDYSRFISILKVEDWPKLEPRAICIRISIVSSLIESRTIVNCISSDLKKLLTLIFKGFQNETYFVQLSAKKLISSLIKMEVLTDFILDEFLNFQSDLISQLKLSVSDSVINKLQFYKYLFSDMHTRRFLFQNNIKSKSELENNSINMKEPGIEILNEFCNFIRLLVFQDDVFISNQGIELFSLALSDDSKLYSNNLQVFIRDVIHSVKAFISTFSPKKTKKDSISKFSRNLKLINIIIGNSSSNFLVSSDFGIFIIKFISSILENYSDFKNDKGFTETGVIVMLLKVVSSFKPFIKASDSGKLIQNKVFFNSQNELTELEIESIFKYYFYSFEVCKLLLINLPQLSSVFQITEPQIINYSTSLLDSSLISCTKFINTSFFASFKLLIEELLSIYGQDDLSSWQLFLILKYLISIYSIDLIKLIPISLHSKVIEMISEIMFTDFFRNSDSSSKLEIRKYSLFGPNVILTCSELLNLVMKAPGLSKSLFELSFSISEELLRTCLCSRTFKVKAVKGELFHDDHVELLNKVISILKDTDIPLSSNLILRPEILDCISEFSKSGLSPTTLDSMLLLVEMFLRGSPKNVEIEAIESLVEKLLLYYIPSEQQDNYLLFYNSYRELCNNLGRLANLPDPVQINEEFAPVEYKAQNRHIVNDHFCIDSILGRFSECNLDCIGE
ncbi:uncharacterized protein ELE39_003401 [Cryptosporidium sp. chipmunk genotype I]|uniref:uncharacterized protein n=1 Tax=Cryptosporidium sp. chipmunk genotype I TaxID=1280935 RepID=UPI00351A4BDF|nr:hypothetical protein ELE39_003401 [Cryptosporidium sp. chipmunk genotype I]